MSDSGGGFITGFLFGGIVGAAFGLLLAPKPGQETRNELRNQSDLIRSKMEDIGTAARDKLGPAVDEMKILKKNLVCQKRRGFSFNLPQFYISDKNQIA